MLNYMKALLSCLSLMSSVLIASEAPGPMTISIDNPAFKKLVIAVPKIQAAGQIQSPLGKKLIDEGAQELVRLLQFSGFFVGLADASYSSAWDQFAKAHKTTESTAWILDSKGLSGEDIVQWRALGVDSLTMSALSEDAQK
ncbi:MAG: hypothetical protein NTX25_11965, partial [Proteobacteria bacterium]|nr:hypothetical protein [Pseudomonadota bacterium]